MILLLINKIIIRNIFLQKCLIFNNFINKCIFVGQDRYYRIIISIYIDIINIWSNKTLILKVITNIKSIFALKNKSLKISIKQLINGNFEYFIKVDNRNDSVFYILQIIFKSIYGNFDIRSIQPFFSEKDR